VQISLDPINVESATVDIDFIYLVKDSTSVAIRENEKTNTNNILFTVFPNPFNSSCAITVNVGTGSQPAQIEIYDIRGNVIGATR